MKLEEIANEVAESILDRIKQRNRDLISKLRGKKEVPDLVDFGEKDLGGDIGEIIKILKFQMNNDRITSSQIENALTISMKRVVDSIFRKIGLDRSSDQDITKAKDYLSKSLKDKAMDVISEELKKEECGFDTPKIRITIKR